MRETNRNKPCRVSTSGQAKEAENDNLFRFTTLDDTGQRKMRPLMRGFFLLGGFQRSTMKKNIVLHRKISSSLQKVGTKIYPNGFDF